MVRKSQLYFPNETTGAKELHHPETEPDMIAGWAREKSTAYAVGDVRISSALDSGKYLFCLQEGISGSGSLTISSMDDGTIITDGTVKWEIRTMYNNAKAKIVVASAPSYYQRSQLFSPNKTTITIYPTWTNIDDSGYILSENKSININSVDSWDSSAYATSSNRSGKDFYIYACKPSGSSTIPAFVLSANSTVPNGYTAADSRKIGGFHCLCADVGVIGGHTLSGYVAGDTLPASAWDLKHRALSENEGMVWVNGVGMWFDIYLPSWDGSKLVSKYGAVVADGASSKKFHGEAFAEAFGKIGKRLVRRDEFICAMKGSNEQTNIKNSTDPNTTGGHVDTANRRMISNYGIEDGCGAYWQLAEDQYEAMSLSWTSPNPYMNNYSWQQRSVYDSSVDSQGYGSASGLLRRALLGCPWAGGAYCGSRCVACVDFSSYVAANVSARGVSEPRCAV